MTKYELSDFNGAITDLNKVFEFDPENADAYFWRGKAKKQLLEKQLIATENKDESSVIEDFNKACELGNKDACEAIKEK